VLNYTAIGLTNGQVYYFKVQAENDNGMGTNSTEACAMPATIPTAPQALTATPCNNQVTLTWIKPLSNGGSAITNYWIYQGNKSNGEVFLATIGNVTSYTVMGLSNGLTYYFKISAVNSIGSGANSTEVNTTPIAVPFAPQNFTAVAGNGQIVLNWAAPESSYTTNITGYRIYQGTSSGVEILQVSIGNMTNYTITSLTNGQVFYFKIAAVNSIGTGANSSETSAMPSTVPGTPIGFTAMPGNKQVVLNWAAPASNGGSPITDYQIYLGTTSNNETWLATPGVVLTYTATGLTNGQVYYFKIAAWNAMGIGMNSIEIRSVPIMESNTTNTTMFTTPGMPLNLRATVANRQVMLSWQSPACNGGCPIINYSIYRGTISGKKLFW